MDLPPDQQGPGARLGAWRLATNKSLETIAKATGLTSHTIVGEWERGTRRPGPIAALKLEVETDGAIRHEEWGHDPSLLDTICKVLALRARRVQPDHDTHLATGTG